MKKLTSIILALVPFILWAHQDRYFTYEYDNVTVRFKTGNLFEEINNAMIIGQYAAQLSDSLDYHKPILLDFIHDYGYTYQGKTFSFLNYGSEKFDHVSYFKQHAVKKNTRVMVSYTDSIERKDEIIVDVITIPSVNRQRTIVLRQFGFDFDITHSLNLLHYAITHNRNLKNNQVLIPCQVTRETCIMNSKPYHDNCLTLLNFVPHQLSTMYFKPKSSEQLIL
jgi:hypothetical protein